jgi:hypothetical protein
MQHRAALGQQQGPNGCPQVAVEPDGADSDEIDEGLRVRPCQVLQSAVHDLHPVQLEVSHRLSKEGALPGLGFNEYEPHLRQRQLQRKRRRSSAGADVQRRSKPFHEFSHDNRLDNESHHRVIARRIEPKPS